MKRSIRPSTPADAPAIVSLFGELGMQPNCRPEDLQWKYWAERADWPGPRSFVLISDGAIVAHAAMIPGTLLTGAGHSTTGHVIDWVARRGQAGAGVALMRYIGQQVGSLIAIGGSAETLRILPHIGFRRAGTVTGYVRPLHLLRILRDDRPSWKILPRLVRNALWKLSAPAVDPKGWRANLVTTDEQLERIAGNLPTAMDEATVTGRSLDLLRYALQSTIVPIRLYTMENSTGIAGYFLLASAPGQVRIVDCWMSSPDPAAWRAMIQCAVRKAKVDPQAAEVSVWAASSALSESVRSCGFRARIEAPIYIRPASKGWVPSSIGVQMLDNDAAYFHEDRRAYLA